MTTLQPTLAQPAAVDDPAGRIANPRIRERMSRLEHPDSYDWQSLFPRTTGIGAASDMKRRLRMLESVEPRLERLLYPDERIEYVTCGTLNRLAEMYFLGVLSVVINRTLFLFTSYRVILLEADSKGRARTLMWQVPYDRIRKYGAGTLLGTVALKLEGGGTYRFSGVRRRDRKALKAYVRQRLEHVRESQFAFPSHAARDPLCTGCADPLPKRTRACPECGEEFITPRTPALLSLAIPGLGDAYLGHRLLAAAELTGFFFLILIVVALIADGQPYAVPIGAGLVVAANGIDAIVTHHVASKGLFPKRLAWKSRDPRKGRDASEATADAPPPPPAGGPAPGTMPGHPPALH